MPDPRGLPTVLLVDDQPANLLALEAVLSDLACNLIALPSGEAALKHLLDHDAAAVLLDVNMPRLDGLETATLIRSRERSRDMPIIFITAAEPGAGQLLRGYEHGVDYLIKPFDPIIVRSKVRTFVELYRARERAKDAAVESYRRRQAERERLRLYSLLMQAPVAVAVLTGVEHRFELVNPTYCHMIHRRLEEVIGNTARRVFHELSADHPLFAILDGVLRSGESFRVDEFSVTFNHLRNGDREPAFLQLALEPLRDEDERVYGMISIANEITDQVAARRRIEDSLGTARAALAERDEFLLMATHELCTPLTTIRLQADLLRRRAQSTRDGAAHKAKALVPLCRQVDRLDALVSQLVDVGWIRAGHLELTRKAVDLSELAHRAAEEYRPRFEDAHCELRFQSGRPIFGAWDPGRIEQAVMNLLSNACKFGAGNPVEVEVGHHDRTAFIRVRDHGIGITEDDLGRIFERFERTKAIHHYGGLGLGLWIARSLVEAHGGGITVESAPGEGATFTIELPISAVAAHAGARSAYPSAEG